MPSNSPWFVRKSWAELARSEPDFRVEVEKRSATATATDSLFFGVRSAGEGSASLHLELFYISTTRVLSACMLVLIARERGFVPEKRIKVADIPLPDSQQGSIDLTSRTSSCTYWFDVRLELVLPFDGPQRPRASARLHRNDSQLLGFSPKLYPAYLPSRGSNLLVQHSIHKLLRGKLLKGKLLAGGGSHCPNCFGVGAFDEMAIPKADLESGRTGYDLFSCNQFSGRVACTVCGGIGGRFEAWYLAEHPELIGASFIPGSGLLGVPSA